MTMIWNSGMGTPMPSATTEPGRDYSPTSASGSFNYDASGREILSDSDKWDRYMATIARAMQASAGWEREKLRQQYEDAARARDNARELEQIRDKTQRYGIDVASRDRKRQLEQEQRQFEANHGLELQRLGLQRAQTATDYLSTPDRFVQAGDFLDLSGRVISGGGYAAPSGTPQMKTMSDYASLEGGGNPGHQVGSSQVGGNPNDPRVKALKTLIDAAPPSSEPGLDHNGWAVLNAAKSIYSMNLSPQQQALIRGNKQYQQMLGSAGRRLGYNADDWWQQQQQSLPGQGAGNAA